MLAKTPLAALSLLCLTAPLALGCADSTIDGYGEDEQEQTILDELDLVTPAQTDIEPTGQLCETYGSAALCLDGHSAAFCNYDVDGGGNLIFDFGACVAEMEIECVPGDVKTVDDEICGQVQASCLLDGVGVPMWAQEGCSQEGDTPLVLRFDDAPITMIDAEATPAATFDIAMSAGSCISTDWPSAATPWLAVDLDHSGSIDGGHELFGSGTDLADGSKADNGFLALAAFDGNHDGVVDARDPRFGELLLWRDHDADRRTGPGELETLTEAGVDSLAVRYGIDRECDARGNCAVERSAFSHAGGRGELVDLHLACQ